MLTSGAAGSFSWDDTEIVTTTAPEACCPVCQRYSDHVHSLYVRTVADLPWLGWAVRLDLHTRRFFCLNLTCPCQIFTERVPSVVAPYARRRKVNPKRADCLIPKHNAPTRGIVSNGVSDLDLPITNAAINDLEDGKDRFDADQQLHRGHSWAFYVFLQNW